jgi:hypothetical protein
MSDGDIRVRIDDDDAPTGRPARTEAAPSSSDEQELRRAHTERAHLHAQAFQGQLEAARARRAMADTEAAAAEAAYARAMEDGNYADAGGAQRRIARAEAEGLHMDEVAMNLEQRCNEAVRWASTDPVEAVAQGRTPKSAEWIRKHPSWVLSPQKSAQLQAAHESAIAENIPVDSSQYFSHIEGKIGLREGSATSRKRGETVEPGVRVINARSGEPLPPNAVRMSKREYDLATDGSLRWETGKNRGKPLGVKEFLRRKNLMAADPRWERLPD